MFHKLPYCVFSHLLWGSTTLQSMMPRFLLMLSLALILTACQSGFHLTDGTNLFRDLRGGEFVLHEDVVVTSGRSHVVFRGDASIQGGSEFYPSCELEVQEVLEVAQTVHADVFTIGKVRGMTHYVNRATGSLMLAATDGFRLASGDTSEWIMLAYHMSLHSETQPQVRTLVCGGAYNYPYYAHYPSLHEIGLGLGGAATISLP